MLQRPCQGAPLALRWCGEACAPPSGPAHVAPHRCYLFPSPRHSHKPPQPPHPRSPQAQAHRRPRQGWAGSGAPIGAARASRSARPPQPQPGPPLGAHSPGRGALSTLPVRRCAHAPHQPLQAAAARGRLQQRPRSPPRAVGLSSAYLLDRAPPAGVQCQHEVSDAQAVHGQGAGALHHHPGARRETLQGRGGRAKVGSLA